MRMWMWNVCQDAATIAKSYVSGIWKMFSYWKWKEKGKKPSSLWGSQTAVKKLKTLNDN